MISNIEQKISMIHDSRVLGFLLDSDPYTLDLNFILYVQIFSDYELERYYLEKSLVVFEKTIINKLSILNDIYSGQFFITDIIVEPLESEKFKFTFIFNDNSIELSLVAKNIKIIGSGVIKDNDIQYLPTNWLKLLD